MRLIYILLVLFIYSCANHSLIRDVEQFLEQQIEIPLNMNTVWKGKDTVLASFLDAPIKMVVWYDSLSCLSCEVGTMNAWNSIVAEADSFAQWFHIIYLFTPQKKDLRQLKTFLQVDKFDYPVFIDRNATFVQQNSKLPQNRLLHSFLLDKNNKVVMAGNTLRNPTMWALYKKTIQKIIDNDGVMPEK